MITPRYKYSKLEVSGPSRAVFDLRDSLCLRKAVAHLKLAAPHQYTWLQATTVPVHTVHYLYGPVCILRYEEIVGKTPRQVWAEFDRQADISRASQAFASAKMSRQPGPVRDELSGMRWQRIVNLDLELKMRFCHFGSLMLLEETISDLAAGADRAEVTAVDVGLEGEFAHLAGLIADNRDMLLNLIDLRPGH